MAKTLSVDIIQWIRNQNLVPVRVCIPAFITLHFYEPRSTYFKGNSCHAILCFYVLIHSVIASVAERLIFSASILLGSIAKTLSNKVLA
jgi:hypothetical protein